MEGVYRFLLTPRWWGINVFVLLAIPFCVFMGSWQLGRFEDRVRRAIATAGEGAEPAQREAARPLDELLPVDKETSGDQATATGPVRQAAARCRTGSWTAGAAYYVLTLLRTDERQGPARRTGLAAR